MVNETATDGHAPAFVLKAKDWIFALSLASVTVLLSIFFSVAVYLVASRDVLPLGTAMASGTAAFIVFASYLFLADHSLAYVDIPDRSPRALGTGVLVGIALTTVQVALTVTFTTLGLGEPLGPLGRTVQTRGPGFLVALVAINLVVVAPSEELLYRNGVQKLLSSHHTAYGAIVGAALIFTLPHASNLVLASRAELVTGLLEVFVNGLGFGAAYAYWQRTDVTIVAHGLYNSAVFGLAYLHVFGG